MDVTFPEYQDFPEFTAEDSEREPVEPTSTEG